jgi:Zn-dependent protease with chaperone function
MTPGATDLLWLVTLIALAAWAVAALSAPLLVHLAAGAAPRRRADRLLLVAATPWLAPLAVTAATLGIALAKSAGWIEDHCLGHGPGHPHLCLTHLPMLGLTPAAWAPQALVVGFAAVHLLRTGLRERRAAAEVTALAALSEPRGRLRVAAAARPLAVAHGLLRPGILVTRGLLDALSARQRRILVAHEAAHLRGGDPRRAFALALLTALHLPAGRRRLCRAWAEAVEQAADDLTARRFGADAVAATIARVARSARTESMIAPAMAGADPVARAWRLLARDPGAPAPATAPVYELVLAAVVVGAGLTVALAHHGVETLLGLLLGI